MVIRSLVLLIIFSSVYSKSLAQNKEWKFNTAFSFSPGLLTENTQSIQLHGYLGYLKDKIHIRGDVFYLLNQIGDRPRFTMNHQLYFGAFYHFSDKKLHPYIGFQPGIALTQSSEYPSLDEASGELLYRKAINPVGSPALGFQYYGEKLFFLFFESRYIFGKHKVDTYPVFLDELRFSFGLGLTF